jgi:mono/diheme cytochrome c family protein
MNLLRTNPRTLFLFCKLWRSPHGLQKRKTIAGQRTKRGLILMAALAAALLLAGCAETGQMHAQPRYDPLEASSLFPDGRSARPFVPGTVPYNFDDVSPNDPTLTGMDENGQEPVQNIPVEVTQELLTLGQERYRIFCATCHGVSGEGNGPAVTFRFPRPPSLLEGASVTMSSGEMFEIIRDGRGLMYPYGYRVKPLERWAVIAYIRAMQQNNGPVNLQDLTPEQIQQLGGQP